MPKCGGWRIGLAPISVNDTIAESKAKSGSLEFHLSHYRWIQKKMCSKFVISACISGFLLISNECLAESLFPKFNFDCYAAFNSAWTSPDFKGPEKFVIDQSENTKPRFRIFSADPYTLKVVHYPLDDANRTEEVLTPADVTFEFSGRNFIIGWIEHSSTGKIIFTINTKTSVMSTVTVHSYLKSDLPSLAINQLLVLNCQNK